MWPLKYWSILWVQMRYWSIVVHFYQPPTQELEITKTILESCYLPLLRLLSEKSGFGLTVNISGSLLLQLKQLGANEFFDLVKKLIDEDKVEILNSLVYHPLMPLTPKNVAIKQIEKNSQILKSLLGVKKTNGFFPPELAIDTTSLNFIHSNYILVDESAIEVQSKIQNSIAKYGVTYMLINNRQVCDLIRSYPDQLSVEAVIDIVKRNCDEEGLIVTANDAELFGHHYSERLQLFADLLDSREIKFIKGFEATLRFGNQATQVLDIKTSSWQDCEGLDLWNKNALQRKYIKLLKTIYELMSGNLSDDADDFFYQGTSSCYLYWLSNWPWWHPDLVESGANQLIKAVRGLQISGEEKIKVNEMYYDFLKEMWQYHWLGMAEVKYKEYDEKLGVARKKW